MSPHEALRAIEAWQASPDMAGAIAVIEQAHEALVEMLAEREIFGERITDLRGSVSVLGLWVDVLARDFGEAAS